MPFNFDEPFYPRLARGMGERELKSSGYVPPEDWLTNVRDQFVRTVPREIRSHLEYHGWKVFVALWPTDVPNFAKPDYSPEQIAAILTSDDKRYLREQIEGACFYQTRTIYVALRYQGAGDFWNDFGKIDRLVRLLRHETGHAVQSLAPLRFVQGRFREAMRQDIVELGGYGDMRHKGYGYYTPNSLRPLRDRYEIWAEATAALWGGGQSYTAEYIFDHAIEACKEFTDVLIRKAPSATLNFDELLEAQDKWLAVSEGAKLWRSRADNALFGAGKVKSRRGNTKRQTPEKKLIKELRAAEDQTCNWGLPYRDLLLSPHNVVSILAAELIRKSYKMTSVSRIVDLWEDFISRIPIDDFKNSNKYIQEMAIMVGAKTLTQQLQNLVGQQRSSLKEKLRQLADQQPRDKTRLLLQILCACDDPLKPGEQHGQAPPAQQPFSYQTMRL